MPNTKRPHSSSRRTRQPRQTRATTKPQRQTLESQFEQLHLALAGAREGIWDWNLATNEVFFSPEWMLMLGYHPGEFQPTFAAWESRVHPADLLHVRQALNDHLMGKTEFYLAEHRLQRKDNTWCWILDKGAVVKRDADGKPLRMSGTHTNITELKATQTELETHLRARTAELDQLNQSLRETERRQNALLNNIPDMAWLKDSESRFIAVNQPFAQACGWTPETLVGKTDLDIWPPALAEQYRTDDAQVMRLRRAKRVEEPIADVTGKSVWIETIKTPVLDEHGTVIGTVGIARDISERKQLDELRRQSQADLEHLVQERTEALAQKNQELQNQILERLAIEKDLATQRDFALQVMNTMGQGLTVTDAAGYFEFVNPAYAHILGYAPAELIGKRPQDFSVSEDMEILAQERSTRQRGQASTYEHKIVRRDGQRVDALITGAPRWVNGQLSGAIAVVTDLTERKQMERELRTSQDRYRGIIESQQALIVRVDVAGNFTYVNDVYCRTFGKTRAELLGHTFTPLVHPDDLAHTLQAMAGLHTPPYRIYVEQRALTIDGWRWIGWEDHAIRDEVGNTVEIQGVGTDITEQKRAAESLRVQRDLGLRVGAASNLRDAFAAVLAVACEIEGIDSGGVYLFDRATQELTLVTHSGLSETFITQTRHFAAQSPQVQLILAGKPVYLNYAASNLASDDIRQQEKLVSLAAIPILHEGIAVAALNLASHTHAEIPASTRVLAETLAAQVGNVIAHLNAEMSLLESQRNLQTLFDNLDDFLFILDNAGNILQVNPVVPNRLGYPLEELIGLDVLALHPPTRRAEAGTIIAGMLAGETDYCPVPLMGKDGTLIPVETKVTRGYWGERPVLFGISRDVSARQRAETALRRHATILEAVNLAAEYFLGTADWKTHMPTVLARLGRASEVSRVYIFENFAQTADEVWTSQQYEWCAPGYVPQIDNPDLQKVPYIASGLQRWVDAFRAGKRIAGIVAQFPASERAVLEPQGIRSILLVPIMAGGMWWGMIGFDDCETERAWEISGIDALEAAARILGAAIRRKQIEDSLLQSEAHNRAIIDAIPDMMFRLDAEGRVLDFKASQVQDRARTPGQIRGLSIRDVLPAPVARIALEKIAETLATGKLQTFEYELPLAQGTQTFEARLVTSSAPGTAVQGQQVLAIVRNISERAILEQMKSDFINRAAHELRTPLTTVIMMADLIQEGGPPDELSEYWQVMQRELKRQRILVEKLLAAGRLEKGDFQITLTPLNLGDALRDACSAVIPQAEAKQVTLAINLPPEALMVNANADMLQQVFVNLLSNAVKFTPTLGTIDVSTERDADGVVIRISDTGIGIPPNDLPYLFTRFFRAHNAVDAEVPGSGIGLYIVKGIIEKLRGQVEVTSTMSQGTTFTVRLPLYQELKENE